MPQKTKGIILWMTLLLNSVIAMLVLSNSGLLLQQLSLLKMAWNKQMVQQEILHLHQGLLTQLVNKDTSLCITSLTQGSPIPSFEAAGEWCRFEIIDYRIFHLPLNDCVESPAHTRVDNYYLQIKYSHNYLFSIYSSATSDIKKNVSCSAYFVINTGLQGLSLLEAKS